MTDKIIISSDEVWALIAEYQRIKRKFYAETSYLATDRDSYLTIGDQRGVNDPPTVEPTCRVFCAPANMLAGPEPVGLITGFR